MHSHPARGAGASLDLFRKSTAFLFIPVHVWAYFGKTPILDALSKAIIKLTARNRTGAIDTVDGPVSPASLHRFEA